MQALLRPGKIGDKAMQILQVWSRTKRAANPTYEAQINKVHPTTISTMPNASRRVVGCLNAKREIAWANRTSTRARVRTLAAVASAKARNQNCDASAPMKPANSEGRQDRMIAVNTLGSRHHR